jgi:O-methyltransferase
VTQQIRPRLAAEAEAYNDKTARAYLRLLRRCLLRDLFHDKRYEGDITRPLPYSAELRWDGRDWPTDAETMVGWVRLESLENCCATALREHVPGDFVETGIWRGGCGILMRAILEAYSDENRTLWLFDSFEGLPKPDVDVYPKDKDDVNWTVNAYLGVTLEQVKANFARYQLLDERVVFTKGWFRDTVPQNAIDSISVLRLDGDMYESTWLVLTHLYPKLSPGGFVIVDDYGALDNCKAAVDEFRAKHSILSPITKIDWTGISWRK